MRQPSTEELATLQEALTKVERDAIQKLREALILCSADESSDSADESSALDVAHCTVQAREQLLRTSHSTVMAINAENAIVRALSHGLAGHLQGALREAQIHTRDIIVLRAQMGVPLGSRQGFVDALTEAYGGELPSNTLARLMHSHGKVVCPLFNYAFVSISCKENPARRQGPRGKRSRDVKRDATRAAESAARAVLSEEDSDEPAASS